jgi:hypothetical protein
MRGPLSFVEQGVNAMIRREKLWLLWKDGSEIARKKQLIAYVVQVSAALLLSKDGVVPP